MTTAKNMTLSRLQKGRCKSYSLERHHQHHLQHHNHKNPRQAATVSQPFRSHNPSDQVLALHSQLMFRERVRDITAPAQRSNTSAVAQVLANNTRAWIILDQEQIILQIWELLRIDHMGPVQPNMAVWACQEITHDLILLAMDTLTQS